MWELFYFKILFIFFWGWIKRGRETSMCDCLSCAPYWGPGPQPRHVPWLGIEPVTLGFSGWCSVHWATLARADGGNFYKLAFNCCQPHFPCKLRRIIQHLNQGLFSQKVQSWGCSRILNLGSSLKLSPLVMGFTWLLHLLQTTSSSTSTILLDQYWQWMLNEIIFLRTVRGKSFPWIS